MGVSLPFFVDLSGFCLNIHIFLAIFASYFIIPPWSGGGGREAREHQSG